MSQKHDKQPGFEDFFASLQEAQPKQDGQQQQGSALGQFLSQLAQIQDYEEQKSMVTPETSPLADVYSTQARSSDGAKDNAASENQSQDDEAKAAQEEKSPESAKAKDGDASQGANGVIPGMTGDSAFAMNKKRQGSEHAINKTERGLVSALLMDVLGTAALDMEIPEQIKHEMSFRLMLLSQGFITGTVTSVENGFDFIIDYLVNDVPKRAAQQEKSKGNNPIDEFFGKTGTQPASALSMAAGLSAKPQGCPTGTRGRST